MYELKAFLCGHFHRDCNISPERLQADGWTDVSFTNAETESLKRMFYSEYVDFFTGSCSMVSKSVNADLLLPFRGELKEYRIGDIVVRQMPLGMTVFSIGISMKVTDLNDVTAVLSSLRMIDCYKDEEHKEFVDKALVPVKSFLDMAVDNAPANISALVENGNKLKVFQVINKKPDEQAGVSKEYADKDLLLYQLGSEVKVTAEIDNYSPSEEYMAKILDESRMSIFRNWQGLALLDTFTILADNAVDWLVDNWTSCYFSLIYIHSVFEKSYLFRLNKQLRLVMDEQRSPVQRFLSAMGVSDSKMYSLIRDFKRFDQKCRFHKISYNFLPLEINMAIDKGLCISEELEQLDNVIEREKQRREEANDKTVNTLLFILSTLTLGSAIWDFSCLVDQMFPYADYLGSTILGYRTVALLVMLALAVVVLRLFRGKNN